MVQPQFAHKPSTRTFLKAHLTVTATTYIAKAGDHLIGVNRSSVVAIAFPTAQFRYGRSYTIKDECCAAATDYITVTTEGSENIDGSATDTISENYGSKTCYSDRTNWFAVPLLTVGSHTLASHSAKAHSDLTGIGTDDHHAQSHTLDSHTGALQYEKVGLVADVSTGDGFIQIKAGSTTVIKSNTSATGAPRSTHDPAAGYAIGSVRIDTTKDKPYVCLDATVAAAIWTEITASGAGHTQAALEAETNKYTYAPPDLIKHSPGVAKCWIEIDQTDTQSIRVSYDVTSIAEPGVGHTDVTVTTGSSTAGYAIAVASGDGTQMVNFGHAVPTATVFRLHCINTNHADVDSARVSAAAYGDQ